MRRLLLIGFGLLLCVLPLRAADWTHVASAAEKSVVYIETSQGTCSGFVIDVARKHVLSAAHCDAADNDRLWVDRVAGKVISKDSKKDLLVIEVPELDPNHVALLLAPRDPAIGSDVMSVGYGYGLERPFFRRATVSDTAVSLPDIGGPFIGVDSGFIGGQSGGPVINAAGEVVSIVQRASDKLGIGVGAAVIRERTGRFWAQ